MNYLTEIRAFYDWLITNPIPSDAQALWHALMHINNKCAWKEEFTVANTTLLSILGFSRQQLDRMRNVLIQTGRIEYKKREGRKAGIYRIIPFVPNNVTQPVTQVETQPVTQPVTQTGHNSSTLNKLNKTKQIDNDDNNSRPKFVAIYEQEFGRPISPSEFERLKAFVVDDGMDDAVICEAIKRARANGVPKLTYVEAILTEWRDNQVTNMAGVKRVDLEFEKRKSSGVKQIAKDKRARAPDSGGQKSKSKYPVLNVINGNEYYG